MVSFVSSVCIWGAVLVIAIRVLSNSGLALGDNKVCNVLFADKSIGGGFNASKKELLAVFGLAFLFRCIVYLISICAIFIMRDQPFDFKELGNIYMQWDAKNYERIALGGYKYYIENGDYVTVVFFPLYPWLIRLFSLIFHSERISGLFLSWALYSGACTYMYKLFSIDYNKESVKRAIIYISVFPHALFFGTMMNESLLLFTAAATLYYIRTHQWYKVGIFGALAALSRMAGILLAVPAAVEWLEHYTIFGKLRQKKIAEVWKLFYSKGLWIFLMLLGTGIYLFCNYKTTGDWFKFLEYQKQYWHNGSVYFGKGITTMYEYMVNTKKFTLFAIWIPEILSVAFVIAALIYGLRSTRSMYSAFLAIYIIINTGFNWPISIARYMTCAIPAFIILSDFSERHKWTEPLITAGMAIAFGVYFTAYFLSKQIL